MELGNYKIKVTTVAESKEAQELFFALGYGFFSGKNKAAEEFEYTGGFYFFAYDSDCDLTVSKDHNLFLAKGDFQELTLPQLRDLAVLHRNDVSDATHVKNDGEMFGYLSSDNIEYTWSFATSNWYVDTIRFSAAGIKPINKELISGADALRALADGREVEFHYADTIWALLPSCANISIFYDDEVKFRLKPRTITLNIETPAPFEPKVGEEVFYINDTNRSGYCVDEHREHFNYNFGAWRTEEEIKQVVAALRGALKNG